jgi:hypothetical protein
MDGTEVKPDSIINAAGVFLLASQVAIDAPNDRPKIMIFFALIPRVSVR